jgi:hypothetical protein
MIKTEEFIEKSRKLFPKYDYSKVEYKNNITKVEIICPIHGEFLQYPKSLLKGIGCKKCSNIKKSMSPKKVIENIKNIHGDIFDFSQFEYKNSYTKIKLKCKIHNHLFETAYGSLQKGRNGCKFCRKNKLSYSNDEFIIECCKKHNNLYDYSKVIYDGSFSKIEIICPKHGSFYQTATDHLRGHGCKKCNVMESQRNDVYDFISKSNKIHNNKYDYSMVKYKNNRTKIEIICPSHGSFYQNPNAHLIQKQGCPLCQKSNISSMENQWLDSIGIPIEFRQKTIKHNNLIYKVDAYDHTINTIYEFYGDYWHGNPIRFNNKDEINKSNKLTYVKLYEKTMIREEELKSLGYKIISIWEHDFLLNQNS